MHCQATDRVAGEMRKMVVCIPGVSVSLKGLGKL